MLRNYVSQDETTNRIQFPKNNFFAYRWRIKDQFNNSIDRQKSHLRLLGGGQDATLLNSRILNLYKSRHNTTCKTDSIADLAQKTLAFLEERRQTQKKISETEVVLATHVRRLLERCYNTLFAFATELNTILGLSELFITNTDPVITNQLNGKPTVHSLLLARLSTNSYSLFMEGTKDKIKFFLLPVEEILSLKDVSSHYNTIACFKAKLEADKSVTWWHDEDLLDDDMVDICCVELLNALIDATKDILVPPNPDDDPVNKESFSLFDPEPWNVEAMLRHHSQKNREIDEDNVDELKRIAERVEAPAQATFEYDEANKRWQHISETPKQYRGGKPKQDLTAEMTLPASHKLDEVFESVCQSEPLIDLLNSEAPPEVAELDCEMPVAHSANVFTLAGDQSMQLGWTLESEPLQSQQSAPMQQPLQQSWHQQPSQQDEYQFIPSMDFESFTLDQSAITAEIEPVLHQSENNSKELEKGESKAKADTKKESSADRRNRRRQSRNLRRKRNSK